MSYRWRMEAKAERQRLRSAEERFNRELYYSHRLRSSEEIFSRYYNRPVTLLVKNGWVPFNGHRYRVDQIESLARKLDARLNGLGD